MNRLSTTIGCLIAALGLSLASGCSESDVHAPAETTATQSVVTPDAESKPNIVFILIDDVGWDDVGYHGSEILTPNIDALAESGVKLERSYVFPICSPTRAALLTGQNPLKYGVDSPMALDASLPLDLTLLPEHLQSAGYDTWLIGKWHLGKTPAESRPTARGFDYFYGFMGGWVDHYTHVFNGGLDWQRNGTSLREEGHATALLTQDAIRKLESHDGDKPYFLYMAYNAPHTPLQWIDGVDRTYPGIENQDRRVYAEMLTDLDAHIGQLISTLEKNGDLNNTLIVLLSDNGGAEPLGSSNRPLKGGKGSAFEGGLRTPALISWKGHIENNQTLEQPVFIHNWAPTLLEAAGIDFKDAEFDGASHWPLVTGKTDNAEREIVAMGTPQSKAVMAWPYKFVRHTPRFETVTTTTLYDLANDPTESNDILREQPKIAKQLAAHLIQYEGIESLAEKGPRPEALFNLPSGKYNYNLRLPEEREPWAEAAEGGKEEASE